MKVAVAAFNQEKALVGAFSVITNLRMELFEALVLIANWLRRTGGPDTRPGTPDTEAAEHSGQLRAARSRGRDPRSAASAADYSGPVLGTARATVSCVPSPYDTDVLGFQVRTRLS